MKLIRIIELIIPGILTSRRFSLSTQKWSLKAKKVDTQRSINVDISTF